MAIEVRGVCTLLQVFDMPKSLHFYRDVLGFEVVNTSNTAYEGPERPLTPESSRVAAHGDTCLYFGCPDVDGAYSYLRANGIDVKEPTIAHYGMKQLYVTDPDGYLLCFQWQAEAPAQ